MSFLPLECSNSNWIPDKDAPKCRKCRTAFTFCHRRHHCRYCGDVFCEPCSFIMDKSYPSAYRKIRICEYCHSLYFTYKDMVQQGTMTPRTSTEFLRNNTCAVHAGATFDKSTKDGKGKRTRRFWLVDVDGTQTIRWTGTNPSRKLFPVARRLSRQLFD